MWATGLDLSLPGLVGCVGAYRPSPPQTTPAKRCWTGATASCLGTHPPSVRGEERAAVPEPRDQMEGGSPTGISPRRGAKFPWAVPQCREDMARGDEGLQPSCAPHPNSLPTPSP